jgi:hypothetical protein
MKKTIIYTVLLFMASITLLSYDLPKDWFKAGDQPNKYDMGVDKGAGRNGKDVATIKSISDNISGFGTLMQQSLPTKYLGKRVRMTGYMKSANVESWAGFWLRVDQAKSGTSLSFDNMQNRAIRGTTGWKKYQIVLDVPSNASMIAYGALLAGTGQIWFDNINFEIVNKDVPQTGIGLGTLPEPENLNFEK